MKTISTLFTGFFLLSYELMAQRMAPQIGLNLVPLLARTLELNATVLRNAERELFVHAGYTFPQSHAQYWESGSRYWEGESRGAYLRVGAKAYFNPNGRFRFFISPHLTAGYLEQAGKSATVICSIIYCYAMESEGKKGGYSLSAGITGGFRVNLLPQVTLDIGIQANRFLGDNPDLQNPAIYIPGYGRRPVQGVALVQYTLKGR
ncbi:hypothetical protein ACFPMF_17100 [Larkinella bovis]|uniref:DUF3575 domain-containing protein n=1 Tax=Larkinella bovis TaxID=683041 RepID=A0ABW0IC45_9BACT